MDIKEKGNMIMLNQTEIIVKEDNTHWYTKGIERMIRERNLSITYPKVHWPAHLHLSQVAMNPCPA
jgi:regulation of enolase protein 1 (concanavalin A-like superfamily)